MDPARSFTAYAQAQESGPGVDWRNLRDGLRPEVAAALERAQKALPFPIMLTSGARPQGRSTSQHFTGNAADVSMRNLSEEQRILLARALIREGGFNRIGAYSGNTGLHVDMHDQRRPDGKPWAMFDRTAAKMDAAPAWFRTAVEATPGTAFAARAGAARAGRATRNGNEITVTPRAQTPVAQQPTAEPVSTFLGLPQEQALALGAGLLGTIAAAFGGFDSGEQPDPQPAPRPAPVPEMAPVPVPEMTLGAPRQREGFGVLPELVPRAAPELIGNMRVRRG